MFNPNITINNNSINHSKESILSSKFDRSTKNYANGNTKSCQTCKFQSEANFPQKFDIKRCLK